MELERGVDRLAGALATRRDAVAKGVVVAVMVLVVATGSLIPTALAPQTIELKLRSYADRLEQIRRAEGRYPPVFSLPPDDEAAGASYKSHVDGYVLCLAETPTALKCWDSRTSSLHTTANPARARTPL